MFRDTLNVQESVLVVMLVILISWKGFKAIRDVLSERERIGRDLHQYEQMLSNATDMLALLDRQHRYRAANDAYLQGVGAKLDELLGQTPIRVVGDETYANLIKPNLDRCLAGEHVHFSEWMRFPTGEKRCVDTFYSPYRDPDGLAP